MTEIVSSRESAVAPLSSPPRASAMRGHRNCLHCILPPHVMKKLLDSEDSEIRQAALDTIVASEQLRGERNVRTLFASSSGPADGRRTIFACNGSTDLLSAELARSEDGAPSGDGSVNRAFDGLGKTYQFYKSVLGRNSIDDRGMRLNGYVHYGRRYNNAFWDGDEMVFGDGDGKLFTDFTQSLDVIGHELTHGVTQFTAGLVYHKQPGALNESMSDVFGSLIKQWSLKQSAKEADWKVGAEIFTPKIGKDCLRSLKEPGSAYDNPYLGKDPQPNHMKKYVQLADDGAHDWGGVHINSGIPNKAFYLTATKIGGNAWEAPGHIWYQALKASSDQTNFQQFADMTAVQAGVLHGANSAEQTAVVAAWNEVGIRVQVQAAASGRIAEDASHENLSDTLALLLGKVEVIQAQLRKLNGDADEGRKVA
ncbi:MAG: M4 family metallopeptidase [Tardiphaga sp.]